MASTPSTEPDSRSRLYRDGTSQAGRALEALDPASVLVDERGPSDWLRFLRQYARHLRYYDLNNEPAGDWSALFPFSDDRLERQLAEAAAFAENPETFAGPAYDAYRRPHFALLLAFLKVLRPVQDRVNEFTRRHLEFYLRDVLGFAPKPGRSGRVHVLIEPAAGQPPFLLPAGTLLAAGQNDEGEPVHYRTDEALVVNQARVAEYRSFHLERKITGLNEIRKDPNRLLAILGKKPAWWEVQALDNRTLLCLLQVALGHPNPGGPLPDYPGPAGPISVDEDLLEDLAPSSAAAAQRKSVGLLPFITGTLHLTLPAFRDLMALRRRLDLSRTEVSRDWEKVKETLQKAGQTKRADPNYRLAPDHLDDFETNLNTALLLNPETAYGGLEEVNDIYGLDRRVKPEPAGSQYDAFVLDARNGLAMKSLKEFKDMMSIVNGFYEDRRRALDILRAAGRRKERLTSGFKTGPVNLRLYDAARWENLLTATLGSLGAEAYPVIDGQSLANLDAVDEALDRLEETFHLTAEEFTRLRQITGEPGSRSWEWDEANGLLLEARRRKELARRSEELKRQGSEKPTAKEHLEAMVLKALADPAQPGQLPKGKSFFALDPDDAGDAAYIQEQLLLSPDEVRELQALPNGPNPGAEDPAWDKAASILDQPRRHRDGWSAPPLEFESWDNIYAAADATRVRPEATDSAGDDAARWHTFGDGPRPDAVTAPGALGFMIASPVLALAEGTRTITLTLRCAQAGFEERRKALEAALATKPPRAGGPFAFRLSTAKGWYDVPSDKATVTVDDSAGASPPRLPQLRCVLRLDAQVPPIAPLPPEEPWPQTQPVLQALLRDVDDPERSAAGPTKPYEAFRSLVIESLGVEVEVDGLAALRLQNDDAVLDPKKPFEPFGFNPVVGSRFVFAHPEICAKRLSMLKLELDWMGLPENLDTHYQNYSRYGKDGQGNPLPDNLKAASFKAALNLYDRRAVVPLKDVPLFDVITKTSLPGGLNRYAFRADPQDFATKNLGEPPPLDPAAGEPLAWARHWELELRSPDFQHAVYPAEVVRAAAAKLTLNPPYTPRLKQLRIAYRASVELDPTATRAATVDQFHHVEPFGYRPATVRAEGGWHFLPQLDNEGELYLGLADAAPPQNLALLFQMADGSADPALPPQTVRWSYLTDNQWRDLDDHHLLSDTTRGLLNTGIIRFDLPVASPSTLLPAGRYWVRATVARHSRAIGDLVAVHTQAVRASRVDASSGAAQTGYLLAPRQLTGLVEHRPEVKAVQQPYSSFGGSMPEAAAPFATRVSERLRHKDRAVTCWDYERLVLEAFPDIYKVKCLPVDSTEDPALASVVQVIVVPDIRGRRPFDPFQPKVPADTLRDIGEFLAARTPANATVQVRNPRYCRLRLRFSVRFQPGCNPAFYRPQLNEEVCRYLSPWAYDDSSDIVFGGRISANLVIYFIEQRPYVDYVAGMKLFLEPEGGLTTPAAGDDLDLGRLVAGAPDLIIVSALAHDIDLIGEDLYEPESLVGIHYMKIELDFRVA